MKFNKAILNARQVDSLMIDENMVLRRMDNGIEITYELVEDGEAIQFKSSYIARVGDYIVRGEMGNAVLVPKAQYAERFTNIDPRLHLYIHDDKSRVDISYTSTEEFGELQLIACAIKPRQGSWRIMEMEDFVGAELQEVRTRMVALDIMLRAIKDLESEGN